LTRFTDLLSPEPLARGLAADLFRGWGASSESLASLVDPCAHVVDAALALMDEPPAR
jgi:hypothetical protein